MFTTERLVLPFTFEALSDRVMDMASEITDASQEATIIPQPESRESFKRKTLPIIGIMSRSMTITKRLLGNR